MERLGMSVNRDGEAEVPLPSRVEAPIPLNDRQVAACREWAADDRLWTTQQCVEFNLQVFARVILTLREP